VRPQYDGSLKLIADSYFSSDKEYKATRPNPILHQNKYEVFDKSGSKVGGFYPNQNGKNLDGKIQDIEV
jgi:hypothetical protein